LLFARVYIPRLRWTRIPHRATRERSGTDFDETVRPFILIIFKDWFAIGENEFDGKESMMLMNFKWKYATGVSRNHLC
jgi:hypothetical protein